jgi:hypothetical protein
MMTDNTITIRGLAVAAAATLATFAVPAHAQYLVDTGTNTSFENNWSLDPAQSLAGSFTLTSAATITSVEGYFSYPGRATISIATNGTLPSNGTRLYSGTLTTGQTAGFDGLFGQNWTLAAGTYWLIFESLDGQSMPDIAANPLAGYAFTYQGDWLNGPGLNVAARIGGTYGVTGGAVPEPATWAMMLIGFGATGFALRRGRPAAQVRFAA